MLKSFMLKLHLQKLSSNSEVAKNTRLVYVICASIILITLSIFNFSLYYSRQFNLYKENNVLGVQKFPVKELRYWYNLVAQHPDYITAWIEIAKLEIARGNTQAAVNAVEFAETIEPNADEVIKIRQQVGKLK